MKIAFNRKEKAALILGIVLLAISIIFFFTSWGKLPDRIATHFTIDGTPNAFGSKISQCTFPIMSTIICVMLGGLSYFPDIYNYPIEITKENMEVEYHEGRQLMLYLNIESLALFLYIQIKSVGTALGQERGVGIFFLPIVLITMFSTVVYKIYRMKKMINLTK